MREKIKQTLKIKVFFIMAMVLMFSIFNWSAGALEFIGEKGQVLQMENEVVIVPVQELENNSMNFFHVLLPSGTTVYFFIVRDKQGIFRAAANACQLCYPAGDGFHLEGDLAICNVCGNPYPLEKIGTEKGDCNPVPISSNLEVLDGNIQFTLQDLYKIAPYFEKE